MSHGATRLPGAARPRPRRPATPGTDPASAAAPPSRRAALMRSGLIIGVLVVVFGIILPRYIDYGDVVAAFKDLTLHQFLVMTALGALAWVVSGLIFSALIEGLSWIRGTMSWLILAGIGASVPFGPWNMGVLWVVVRGWGIGNAPATSGVALYGVINILSRMFLPLFGIVALAIAGDLASAKNAGTAWTIAIISAVAFVVVTGAHRRDRALRADRRLDRANRPARRRLDPAPPRAHRLAGRGRGDPPLPRPARPRHPAPRLARPRASPSVSQFAWAIVLLVSLRICGVPAEALSAGEVFGVYALVMCITIIPLSPGGAGVPELLFISALLDDRRAAVPGRDHGRRLPVPDVLLVRARSRWPGCC